MSVSDFRKSTAALIVGTVTNSLSINNVTISSNSSPRDGWILVATGSNSAIWRDGIAFGSNATDVSSVGTGGSSASNSRADHVHRGVRSISHTSNTAFGDITFTTPGNTVGITVPTPGTFAFTATGGTAAGGTTGAEADYVEFTADVTISATTEGTANTIVTANAISCDGTTAIIVEFFAPHVTPAASAGANIWIVLYQDGASIGLWGLPQTPATGTVRIPVALRRRLIPSSGSHTFSVRGFRAVGNGAVAAGVGGSGAVMPGFIRITRVS